ncbi:MAG: protein phosphatase CheZ [Sedimenticola sp.]
MDLELRLARARELVSQLEAGDEQGAKETILELSNYRESELFQEVGRLTRALHQAINGFLLNGRLAELAHQEVPDAGERLNYVVRMTEEAANSTLSAVESGLPLADELGQLSKDLQQAISAQQGDTGAGVSQQELGEFLERVEQHSAQLHGKLSEVLMAQEFQDLTGQIIRQVITLVNDVEEKLVHLVRISGAKSTAQTWEKGVQPSGPAVPGVNEKGTISGQDEVDDLLSSLGF